MARKRTSISALDPWTRLALQWSETMLASGAVIAHRTSRRNTPTQLLAMGTEKAAAALEASSAMAAHAARMQTLQGAAWANAWARMFASGLAPYRARALRNARNSRRRRR